MLPDCADDMLGLLWHCVVPEGLLYHGRGGMTFTETHSLTQTQEKVGGFGFAAPSALHIGLLSAKLRLALLYPLQAVSRGHYRNGLVQRDSWEWSFSIQLTQHRFDMCKGPGSVKDHVRVVLQHGLGEMRQVSFCCRNGLVHVTQQFTLHMVELVQVSGIRILPSKAGRYVVYPWQVLLEAKEVFKNKLHRVSQSREAANGEGIVQFPCTGLVHHLNQLVVDVYELSGRKRPTAVGLPQYVNREHSSSTGIRLAANTSDCCVRSMGTLPSSNMGSLYSFAAAQSRAAALPSWVHVFAFEGRRTAGRAVEVGRGSSQDSRPLLNCSVTQFSWPEATVVKL
ncbi:hypothetical protein EYF80_048873 [Liparis tanakae]|uniref:Uncharacterized protein n=1 Tax=Liparis tanakae TaxID=230148 RepID=A0A4Z2FJK7_9TELE|nr:hypothetical protein EYF80_048873 [Liparis tanakae]